MNPLQQNLFARFMAKCMFVFITVCIVLAFWMSLVSCVSLTKEERDMIEVFDLLNQADDGNVWPQGCETRAQREQRQAELARQVLNSETTEFEKLTE